MLSRKQRSIIKKDLKKYRTESETWEKPTGYVRIHQHGGRGEVSEADETAAAQEGEAGGSGTRNSRPLSMQED